MLYKNVRGYNEDGTASWKTLWDDDIKQVSHSDIDLNGKTSWKSLRHSGIDLITYPKLRGTGHLPIQRRLNMGDRKKISHALDSRKGCVNLDGCRV